MKFRFGYRDMGVSEIFFHPQPDQKKEYDFIYSGNLSPQRKLDQLLKVFDQGPLKKHSHPAAGK